MLTDIDVKRVVEKYNLKPLEHPEDARRSVQQVVLEMKTKGFSNVLIGSELGMAESSIRTIVKPLEEENKFKAGDHVQFKDFEDSSITHHGVVLDFLQPSEDFVGGYHIACYFVVAEDSLEISNDRKFDVPSPAI